MSVFAVASGHYLTSQAASSILEQGGNAYDAILAAMMMSFVAEPLLSSPGGGGFMLAGPVDEAPLAYDFFAHTPYIHPTEINQLSVDFYPIQGDFGDRQQEFHIGATSCALPLVIAGLYTIHQQLATLPLDQLAQPAIQTAKNGLKINQQQASVAQILQPIIQSTTAAQQLYANMEQGMTWKNPQLAAFLDSLSRQEDQQWFYQGPVMKDVCSQTGVLLTHKDCQSAQANVQKPLHLSINDYQFYTSPLPSTGGNYVVEQLKQASQYNEITHQHLYAMQQVNHIMLPAEMNRGTSHISVVDGQGNLASMTLSNGEGNGMVLPEYGFMMNNFLGEEDINPNGFFAWDPGQKMKSMMAPSLIINNQNRIALGTGGSNRIKTALYQVSHRIIQGQSLKEAINAPRIHYEKQHLDIEPGLNTQTIQQLKNTAPNHTEWQQCSLYFGGINAVQYGNCTLGYADFRRNGCGMTGFSKDQVD